jgi:hypothetical protein
MKQHEPATAVLRAINNSATRCLTLKTLVCQLKHVPKLAGGQMDAAIRYLAERKMVEHHQRGCWRITPWGERAALSEDGVLKNKTGVSAGPTKQQTQGATGIRGAAWRALRIKFVLTIDEVCALIDDGTEANVGARVSVYFRALAKVGVLDIKLITANRAPLFLLRHNLGPLAPTVGQRGQIFDPNAGAFLPVEALQ